MLLQFKSIDIQTRQYISITYLNLSEHFKCVSSIGQNERQNGICCGEMERRNKTQLNTIQAEPHRRFKKKSTTNIILSSQ